MIVRRSSVCATGRPHLLCTFGLGAIVVPTRCFGTPRPPCSRRRPQMAYDAIGLLLPNLRLLRVFRLCFLLLGDGLPVWVRPCLDLRVSDIANIRLFRLYCPHDVLIEAPRRLP